MKTWLVALVFLGSAIDAGGMVAGGGRPTTDCYAVFDGVTATRPRSTRVRCVDGDPTCDHDCVPGQCTFTPRVCLGAPALPGCTPPDDVTVLKADGRLALTPLARDTSGRCAPPSTIVVPTRGRHRTTRLGLLSAAPGARGRRDRDRVILRCLRCRGPACAAAPTGSSAACPANPDGGPRQLTVRVETDGSDLDIGWTGNSDNFPIPEGTSLSFCLSGCDGTTTTRCDGHGTTGPGSLNGRTFGPPLPLFASGIPVCAINRFRDADIRSHVDVGTGAVDMTELPLQLDTDVFLTAPTQLCPRCVTGGIPTLGARGTCEDDGAACTIEGLVTVNNPPTVRNAVYGLSSSCLPDTGLQGTIKIALPLTSGLSELRPVPGERPCPGEKRHGMAGAIGRQGVAVPPAPPFPDATYPKRGPDAVLAAAFCIGSSGSPIIDTSSGLPGPGALLLRGTHTLLGPAADACGP